MGKIKAIVKRPDEPTGHMTHISNTLENLQSIVGGYIETVTLPTGCVLICNEEGKLNGLPKNFRYGITIPDTICGTVIVVGTDGEDFSDVPIDLGQWRLMLELWGNNTKTP